MNDSFGKQLRRLRLQRGLRSNQLARKLRISPPYLSQLESDRAMPSEELARRIARFFRIDEDETAFFARRVTAELGVVMNKFPRPVANYLGRMAQRPPEQNSRRKLMVRLVAEPKSFEMPRDKAGERGAPFSAETPAVTTKRFALPDTFDLVRPSIVAFASKLVKTQPGEMPLFPAIIGTGFVVDSDGIVITNQHVVDELQALPRHPVTGEPSDVAIVWSDVQGTGDGHVLPILFVDIKGYSSINSFSSKGPFYGEPIPDLAFVQLNVRDIPSLGLATEPDVLRAGLPVATAGFPLGTDPLVLYGSVTQLTPFLRQGIVSSLYPFACPQPHGFTIDVMSQGGASGSPVFLTDSPKVVGMVHAGIPGTNVTVAIPSRLLADALSACTCGKPLDLGGVPTLRSLLTKSERSSDLRWDSFLQRISPPAAKKTEG